MSVCTVNDQYCSNNAKVRCRALCAKHYSRMLVHGDPTLIKHNIRPRKAGPRENWCGRCSSYKPVAEFSKSIHRSNGLTSICKTCAAKRWKDNYDPVEDRFRSIKYKYGLTEDDYKQLLVIQVHKCAICRSPDKLHVDHCHRTGKVRGLLCFRCNSTLGKVEESKELLNSLINYLEVKNV